MRKAKHSPLATVMKSVRCVAHVNGMMVIPDWRDDPDLLARINAASNLAKLVNAHLKGKK